METTIALAGRSDLLSCAACSTRSFAEKWRKRGFTLTELLVTISVVAILASIAYPSFQGHVLKVRRTDARQSLTQTVQQLERCYSRYRAFDSLDCPLVSAGPTLSTTSIDGRYVITSQEPDAEDRLGTESVTLYAIATGAQAGDRRCAWLSLTNALVQGAEDNTGADTTAECW